MVENGDMYTNLQFGLDAGSISEGEGHDDEHNDGELLREQDRFLPIANVARIMKRSVPRTGKIAKEAKDCLQECVSEFVSFITSEASERCHQEKRKTINGEDLLYAMSQLGFDNYIEPLKIYLQKYRDATKNDKCFIQTINMEGTGEDLSGEESFLALTEQNGESALLYGTNFTIAPAQF